MYVHWSHCCVYSAVTTLPLHRWKDATVLSVSTAGLLVTPATQLSHPNACDLKLGKSNRHTNRWNENYVGRCFSCRDHASVRKVHSHLYNCHPHTNRCNENFVGRSFSCCSHAFLNQKMISSCTSSQLSSTRSASHRSAIFTLCTHVKKWWNSVSYCCLMHSRKKIQIGR